MTARNYESSLVHMVRPPLRGIAFNPQCLLYALGEHTPLHVADITKLKMKGSSKFEVFNSTLTINKNSEHIPLHASFLSQKLKIPQYSRSLFVQNFWLIRI